MSRAVGYGPSTIHRIWKAFCLKPHRSETFKLSKDPLFVEKVRDIVGLYLDPPERALVLNVEVQAFDRTQPLLPMCAGPAERRIHDYKRNGTTSLFAALDIAIGKVLPPLRQRGIPQVPQLHRGQRSPRHPHRHGQLRDPQDSRWSAKRLRQHVHYTPTSVSWIKVERFFGLLTEKQLRLGVHQSIADLERAIQAHTVNDNPKLLRWIGGRNSNFDSTILPANARNRPGSG